MSLLSRTKSGFVVCNMDRLRRQFEIVVSIVFSVSVFVMNNLRSFEVSTKSKRHNEAMLLNISVAVRHWVFGITDFDVPVVDSLTSIPIMMFRTRISIWDFLATRLRTSRIFRMCLRFWAEKYLSAREAHECKWSTFVIHVPIVTN
jgi:hypothetical protein